MHVVVAYFDFYGIMKYVDGISNMKDIGIVKLK